MQAGVEVEGEDYEIAEEHRLAVRCWVLLNNGMGGIDWAGLPYVMARYGVPDAFALMDRLLTIRTHRPPKAGQGADKEN